ncbi:DUF3604 domain-containing protein [Vibrio lentus]|uniref:Uncharacterized protein n=2 Tax=Vibrio lentus TaxID=136468 RepID=A0AB36XLB8_9VIBR|nr:hypothetical protein BCU51_15135 [Vibrio lentus]PMK31151.1 hypothetical protein BCU02_25870 [Vibrio lentus]PMK45049.1 hypothetical protein BCT99_23930 [Vibrio lentus]PML29959.1 hypothetical protein BCT79_23485 [Vibrio lentus]PMM42802.1 hypothetical protein BCT56_23125 [Vibrio lentus]
MMQINGNSEVHRKFWPEDEFANYENADSIQKSSRQTFHKNDFVRKGLKQGLVYERLCCVIQFRGRVAHFVCFLANTTSFRHT